MVEQAPDRRRSVLVEPVAVARQVEGHVHRLGQCVLLDYRPGQGFLGGCQLAADARLLATEQVLSDLVLVVEVEQLGSLGLESGDPLALPGLLADKPLALGFKVVEQVSPQASDARRFELDWAVVVLDRHLNVLNEHVWQVAGFEVVTAQAVGHEVALATLAR